MGEELMNSEIDEINIQRLIEGYQYYYLPSDFLLHEIDANIKNVINKLVGDIDYYSNQYGYMLNNDLISVSDIKEIEGPKYIHNFGSEPIGFFDFKKNGSFREIQIPNLAFYIPFIYNSIKSCENLFNKIYVDDNDFVKCSNSNIIFEHEFIVTNPYDEEEQTINTGEFAIKNNKLVSQMTSNQKAINFFEKMSSYFYVLKLDIESFYPNVYTHLLSKLIESSPYNELQLEKYYFEFLDTYNMKINYNQTKGIISGCFSSNVSSELLLLTIDYYINNYLSDKDVSYIRYVDDFTFFADSKEVLQNLLVKIQQLLTKYKLRINHNKTEIIESVLFQNCLDFNNIDHDFELLKDIWNEPQDFVQLKVLFKKYLENNKISELKVLLTKIARNIENNNDDFNDNNMFMVNYLLQLMFYDPNLAVNCYKVLDRLLDANIFNNCDAIFKSLENKTTKINEEFSNTLIQIWHYYILNKYNDCKSKIYFKELKESFGNEINPLILISFIKNGYYKNTEIMKYIKKTYQESINDSKNLWKKSIMLSKWSLILINIRHVDKYNYYSFFESNDFKQIWRDLSE